MRIAFFSDNFYPELSGITDTITTTGTELSRRGHYVVYIAPSYSENDYLLAKRIYPKSPEDDKINGIPIVRLSSIHLPLSPTGQSRLVYAHKNALTFLKEFRPEVIHTQSPYTVGWCAIRAGRRLQVPVVGTNHTAVEDFFPFLPGIRFYDAYYYNQCDFVTTPYSALIKKMHERGFSREAQALPNPVDLEKFSKRSEEERANAKKEFGFNGPVVLQVGRLGFEKRVDVTLRAIARIVEEFPEITFVATGHGAAEESLRRLARELGIEKNVQFVGLLPREKLITLYAASDVFALMSTSDSQSLALMEAYATGIPAVCARARGLPDYTPESCSFLITPNDDAGEADKILLLLRDKEIRLKMGEAARKYVEQFSAKRIADKWEEVYKQAIERAHST